MEDVMLKKMSQFWDGNFGRLDSQEAGIPVNSRADLMPDLRGDGS